MPAVPCQPSRKPLPTHRLRFWPCQCNGSAIHCRHCHASALCALCPWWGAVCVPGRQAMRADAPMAHRSETRQVDLTLTLT